MILGMRVRVGDYDGLMRSLHVVLPSVVASLFLCSCSTPVERARILLSPPEAFPKIDPTGTMRPTDPYVDEDKESNPTVLRDKLKAFALLRGSGEMGINDTDIYRETALSKAVRLDEEKVVRELLDQGADPNIGEAGYGESVLSRAARNGNLRMVKLLVERGADVNRARFCEDDKPLHNAVRDDRNAEMVRYLIRKGANVNEQGDEGGIPLFHATPQNTLILLEKGANPNFDFEFGNYTPLAMCFNNYRENQDPDKDRKIMEKARILIKYGAKINVKEGFYLSALHQAINTGNPTLVQFVLEHGANPNIKDQEGRNALAIIKDDFTNAEEIRQLLRSYGAK